jgi:hypothetical protein
MHYEMSFAFSGKCKPDNLLNVCLDPHESYVAVKEEFPDDAECAMHFAVQAHGSHVIIKLESPGGVVPFTCQAHEDSSGGLSSGDDLMMGNLFVRKDTQLK